LSATNSNAGGNGHQAYLSFQALNAATSGANVHPSNEGSAFGQYNCYRDGVWMNDTGSGLTTDVFDNGLVNGQLYQYTVSAVNANGEGAPCAPVPFIPSCAPDAPTNIAVSHRNHQATITGDLLAVAPSNVASDEGSAIQQYQIQISSDGGVNWTAVEGCASNVSSFVKMGLTNGQTYDFRVSAQNANGTSPPSASAAVVPSNSPSSVRNVHIVANAAELQVIWDKPAISGGLAYDYSIEVADPSGGIAYQGTQYNRYAEIQNLATSVQYTVPIYAFNNVDTNYVMYSAQSTTVPAPIEVTSLEWDNTQPNSSVMKWRYNSDVVYAGIEFLLAIMDIATDVFSSVFVPAHNAVPDESITQNLDADGISPMSNIAQVR
jgi:hypothetical protein